MLNSDLKMVGNEDLEKAIAESVGSVEDLMNGFSTTIHELRNGIRPQRELAAVIAKAVKCSLCSIANMASVGDIDGLEALRECAAMESGCKEVVQSH